jgi:hypothetical protein
LGCGGLSSKKVFIDLQSPAAVPPNSSSFVTRVVLHDSSPLWYVTPRNLKAPILLQFLFFEPLIERGIELGNTAKQRHEAAKIMRA